MVLQISIIIAVLLFLGVIILLLRKSSLSLRNSLLWLLTALVMLLFGVFPQLLTYVATLFGFALPSNALFTFLLGFIIIILLQQSVLISRQSDNIKTLIQSNALLEKRIRDLESLSNAECRMQNAELGVGASLEAKIKTKEEDA